MITSNEILKVMRKGKGVTQNKAADDLTIGRNSLITLERGARELKGNEVLKFASYYNITPNMIFGVEPLPTQEVCNAKKS